MGNHSPGPSGFITVSRFPGDANGNVSPSSEFFVDNVTAVARDTSGNIYVASDTGRIFVASTSLNSIVVFDVGASGNVTPFRKIQGSSTGLNNPLGIAVRY